MTLIQKTKSQSSPKSYTNSSTYTILKSFPTQSKNENRIYYPLQKTQPFPTKSTLISSTTVQDHIIIYPRN